jgi:hypothetical protein
VISALELVAADDSPVPPSAPAKADDTTATRPCLAWTSNGADDAVFCQDIGERVTGIEPA